MARGVSAFGPVVAARTAVAAQILGTPDLLKKYLKVGGGRSDLESIQKHGLAAEAANHAQGSAKTEKGLLTAELQTAFFDLKREYARVMIAVRSLRGELEEEGDIDGVTRLTDIIKNEATTGFQSLDLGDGKTVKKEQRVRSYEVLRAEMARDAVSLLGFTRVATKLSERGVTRPRLEKLKADAEALTGKLVARGSAAGAKKETTAQEREAVAKQRARWEHSRPALDELAKIDGRVVATLILATKK